MWAQNICILSHMTYYDITIITLHMYSNNKYIINIIYIPWNSLHDTSIEIWTLESQLKKVGTFFFYQNTRDHQATFKIGKNV